MGVKQMLDNCTSKVCVNRGPDMMTNIDKGKCYFIEYLRVTRKCDSTSSTYTNKF